MAAVLGGRFCSICWRCCAVLRSGFCNGRSLFFHRGLGRRGWLRRAFRLWSGCSRFVNRRFGSRGRFWLGRSSRRGCVLCKKASGCECKHEGKCDLFHVFKTLLRVKNEFVISSATKVGQHRRSANQIGGKAGNARGEADKTQDQRASIHCKNSLALALLTNTGSFTVALSLRSNLRAKYCSTSVTAFACTRNWRLAR